MFSYSQGRGAQHARKLYAGVQPGTVLMIDGYELYNGIAHDHQLVHLGYCSLTRLPSAQAGANLYSLVETYNANGINPYRYLVWLFARLPLAETVDDYAELLPWKLLP